MSNSVTRLFCPWDSPGKDTGVHRRFLLQGIFPTQGLNPGLLNCRQTFIIWATRETFSEIVTNRILKKKKVDVCICVTDSLFCTPETQFSSVQFSLSVVSDSLHTRPPCPSPTPRVYPNSCPMSRWCHLTISSSVVPSTPAFNISQQQGFFQRVSSLY